MDLDNFTRPKAGFYLIAFSLIFAPLIWGSNVPLPLLFLELLALALLAQIVWQPAFRDHLSRSMQMALLLLLLLPLLQLIPLPLAFWATLPGRETYAQAFAEIDGETGFSGWRAISLIPFETERAWLALLPPFMIFMAAVGLSSRQLQTLVVIFLGVATFEAILGLIQYGDGAESPFRLGNTYMGKSASGTYINRNHLAGLLEMALPIGLALVTATLGHSGHRHSRRSRRPLRRRLAELGSLHINQAAVYGAVSLAILLGLIFTRSRAGIAMAVLGILLCTLVFSRRLGGNNVYGLTGTFTAIGIALAAMIGLAPIWERFALQDPLGDGRWLIFSGTLRAIGTFFPLGSGSGTFEEVFHRFHPSEMSGVIVNRAHNDYLEGIMEMGLPAAALVLMFLVLYLRQWPRVWQRGAWSSFRFIQVGAGIALLLMLLHSLMDFNLHIPANAIFFALLAALFFHRYQEKQEGSIHRQRQTRRSDEDKSPARAQTLPSENASNPFAEPEQASSDKS